MTFIPRDPDPSRLSTSERVIYRAWSNRLMQAHPTPERAVLRAAKACGVSRHRVLDVLKKMEVSL